MQLTRYACLMEVIVKRLAFSSKQYLLAIKNPQIFTIHPQHTHSHTHPTAHQPIHPLTYPTH